MTTVDLKEYAFKVLEIARENLTRDGVLEPAAFLVTADDLIIVDAGFTNEEEKQAVYGNIVQLAREKNAIALLTLNDARYEPDDAPRRESLRPGQLEEEGAPECILLSLSGPGIENWVLLQPYERTAEGIRFGDLRETAGGQVNLLPGWATGPGRPS
jgi:hypothetical protein